MKGSNPNDPSNTDFIDYIRKVMDEHLAKNKVYDTKCLTVDSLGLYPTSVILAEYARRPRPQYRLDDILVEEVTKATKAYYANNPPPQPVPAIADGVVLRNGRSYNLGYLHDELAGLPIPAHYEPPHIVITPSYPLPYLGPREGLYLDAKYTPFNCNRVKELYAKHRPQENCYDPVAHKATYYETMKCIQRELHSSLLAYIASKCKNNLLDGNKSCLPLSNKSRRQHR